MRKLVTLGCFVVLGFGIASPSVAQDGPEWYEVRTMVVPGHCMAEWRAVQRDAVNPALQEVGYPWREAWQTVFGTSRQFTFVSPLENLAQFEELDPQFPPHAREVLRRCNMDHRVEAVLLNRNLSNMRAEGTPPSVALVSYVQLAPDAQEAWMNLIETEVGPAMQQSNSLGFHVFSRIFGSPEQFVTVNFRSGLDAFVAPPMVQALGPEAGGELNARRRALRTHNEMVIMRFVPELSFGTE